MHSMKRFQVDQHSFFTLSLTYTHTHSLTHTRDVQKRYFEWLTTEELTDGCSLCTITAASLSLSLFDEGGRLHHGHQWKLIFAQNLAHSVNVHTLSARQHRQKTVVKWGEKRTTFCIGVFLLRQIERTSLSLCQFLKTTVRVPNYPDTPNPPAVTKARGMFCWCYFLSSILHPQEA